MGIENDEDRIEIVLKAVVKAQPGAIYTDAILRQSGDTEKFASSARIVNIIKSRNYAQALDANRLCANTLSIEIDKIGGYKAYLQQLKNAKAKAEAKITYKEELDIEVSELQRDELKRLKIFQWVTLAIAFIALAVSIFK